MEKHSDSQQSWENSCTRCWSVLSVCCLHNCRVCDIVCYDINDVYGMCVVITIVTTISNNDDNNDSHSHWCACVIELFRLLITIECDKQSEIANAATDLCATCTQWGQSYCVLVIVWFVCLTRHEHTERWQWWYWWQVRVKWATNHSSMA